MESLILLLALPILIFLLQSNIYLNLDKIYVRKEKKFIFNLLITILCLINIFSKVHIEETLTLLKF
jgi:hypothetical protein